MDERDYFRFVCGLEVFNNKRPVEIFSPQRDWLTEFREKGPTRSLEREMLVDIHGWCLMENHYHLLISEKADGGLKKFITKLNVGYAKYFNEKYRRSGTLFESRTKKIHIEHDSHFLHILHYIHFNPLDYRRDTARWRERALRSVRAARTCLEDYRWSSYRAYCGSDEFSFIITKSLFNGIFKDYRKDAASYLGQMRPEDFQHVPLE